MEAKHSLESVKKEEQARVRAAGFQRIEAKIKENGRPGPPEEQA